MGKVLVRCGFCGTIAERYPSHVKPRNFCSKECKDRHVSKRHNPESYRRNFNAHHLPALNAKLNPERMTAEVREKLRQARLDKGRGISYPKTYGRHTHRIVAEELLGRALRPGEVVHHIDGNKRNNTPENLMVFPSQREHARWHQAQREVMST